MDQVVCMTSWLRNLHRRAACMGELDADETMIAGLRQAEVEGTRARCAGDEIYRRIDAVAVEHGAREDHPRQTVAGSLRTDVVHGLHEPGLCHREGVTRQRRGIDEGREGLAVFRAHLRQGAATPDRKSVV